MNLVIHPQTVHWSVSGTECCRVWLSVSRDRCCHEHRRDARENITSERHQILLYAWQSVTRRNAAALDECSRSAASSAPGISEMLLRTSARYVHQAAAMSGCFRLPCPPAN